MSMSLSSSSSSLAKTLTLGGLYFVQGLPYGFQDKLMPVLLVSGGHSPSAVALVRLLMLPWLAKALFAPIVDMTLSKRQWVQLSLVALVGISTWNVAFDMSLSTTPGISHQLLVTLFALNFFSALQDIAVDGIALAILSTEAEVAGGNSSQIVGYKLGSFFGSACLFTFYSLAGWQGLFASLGAVYLVVLIAVSYIVPAGEYRYSHKHSTQKSSPKIEKTSVSSELTTLPTLLLYVFVYKMGEVAAAATFPVFLLATKGATSGELVFWNGTIGMAGSILGSLLASVCSLRHLRPLLAWRLFPLAIQLLVIISVDHLALPIASGGGFYYVAIASLLLLQLLGGLITALTFTLMMLTCQRLQRAQPSSSYGTTRYSLVSSVEVFGKLLFSSFSGLVVETIGFGAAQAIFMLALALPLLSLG